MLSSDGKTGIFIQSSLESLYRESRLDANENYLELSKAELAKL